MIKSCIFPSGEVQVYLQMMQCGNIVLMTDFLMWLSLNTLTPLSLLISCKLSFPTVCLKIPSLCTFILKPPNKISIRYFCNWFSKHSSSSMMRSWQLLTQSPSYRITSCRLFMTAYSTYSQQTSKCGSCLLHSQHKDAPCCVARDPNSMGKIVNMKSYVKLLSQPVGFWTDKCMK
jgi:hypothetical protein